MSNVKIMPINYLLTNCWDKSEAPDRMVAMMTDNLPLVCTGPKLYKEPSSKSNKHIIQNALAHCCLAGKVNEGQKNKILEVMCSLQSSHSISTVLVALQYNVITSQMNNFLTLY